MLQYYLKCAITASVAAVTVALLIQFIHKFLKKKKLIDEIPGPAGNQILGNFLDLLPHFQSDKLWVYIRVMAQIYYPIGKFCLLHKPLVFVMGPEDIESVISTIRNTQKGEQYKNFHPWLGNGLLTNYGSSWYSRRKILTPAFHFNILQQFMEVFAEQSQLLVENLQKECSKPSTSIEPYITEFTLRSICETAMGTQLDTKERNLKEYKSALYEIGKLLVYRSMRPWLFPDSVFYFTRTYKKQKTLAKIMHQFSMNVIRNRKVNFKEVDDAILNNQSDDQIPKKRLAMLDLLLTAQNSGATISEVEIREEVDTFIFEGHDTTTIAISFILLQLANNKDIQDRIVDELSQVLGENDKHATYQQLQDMQYLERVIKESLRMYPSVPVITRITSEDTVTHSGYTIPAGTNVLILIYDLHHNAELYPDPFKFDPDRFLPENHQKRHAFAYLPFSAGPRNCIGQKFAMMELKSVISAILRKYVLKPVDKPSDMRFITDMVLRTENEVRIKFELR